jgi:hypothetical protein
MVKRSKKANDNNKKEWREYLVLPSIVDTGLSVTCNKYLSYPNLLVNLLDFNFMCL